MNRLQHFFRAGTAYGLHSPFVYRLYTEALGPRRGADEPAARAQRLVQRLQRHYGAKPIAATVGDTARLVFDGGEFLVVDRPHRREAEWQALCRERHWTVAVDLYSVGLLIHNTNLHPEHYILR